jgi:nitrile hydratase accessory protein
VADFLEGQGPAAPPRRNGELVFAAPWESRVFGATVALQAAGVFTWEDFRRRLIAAIARGEAPGGGDGRGYWASWLAALEAVLAEAGVCASHELDARADRLAARTPGHDH